MKDRFGRNINYMRISITDQCNLHCRYCMPKDAVRERTSEFLTYEEIGKVVEACVGLGITHYRITGGEPLVRKDCEKLIQMLHETKGVESVDLTTNGVLLAEKTDQLKQAGIGTLNVSLDTLDAREFTELTGEDRLKKVLDGIALAKKAEIPVKINTVNREELNWKPILKYASENHLTVRFIEIMPIGYGKNYTGRSNQVLLEEIQKKYGTAVIQKEENGNGPAVYYRFERYPEKIGFISAINHKFCDSCNRLRLTADGYLKLCLCHDKGIGLKNVIRDTTQMQKLERIIEASVYEKPLGHNFTDDAVSERRKMFQIGG